jgi:HTH-type transcriptional regulator / antitoxin HigA
MEALTFFPTDLEELAEHFGAFTAKVPLRPITTEPEYANAVRALNALLDSPDSSEGGPLASLLVTLGKFIGDYEDANHHWDELPPNVMLRELMTMNGVTQAQLQEVGS